MAGCCSVAVCDTGTDLSGLLGAVGTSFSRTEWLAIDQARIDAFAECTADRQWIHVDVARAAAGPYGTAIAHGYLTLSLVSPFLGGLIEVTDSASALNYGLDRVRFPAPVPVDSRLRGSGELLAANPIPDGVQTTTRVTVGMEGRDKPACVAEVLTRFLASGPGRLIPTSRVSSV